MTLMGRRTDWGCSLCLIYVLPCFCGLRFPKNLGFFDCFLSWKARPSLFFIYSLCLSDLTWSPGLKQHLCWYFMVVSTARFMSPAKTSILNYSLFLLLGLYTSCSFRHPTFPASLLLKCYLFTEACSDHAT